MTTRCVCLLGVPALPGTLAKMVLQTQPREFLPTGLWGEWRLPPVLKTQDLTSHKTPCKQYHLHP